MEKLKLKIPRRTAGRIVVLRIAFTGSGALGKSLGIGHETRWESCKRPARALPTRTALSQSRVVWEYSSKRVVNFT